MPRPAPTWSVFRRTPDGFDRVATVEGECEGNAFDAACRIPGGPRNPILARAHSRQGDPVDFSLIPAPARRSRRHAHAAT